MSIVTRQGARSLQVRIMRDRLYRNAMNTRGVQRPMKTPLEIISLQREAPVGNFIPSTSPGPENIAGLVFSVQPTIFGHLSSPRKVVLFQDPEDLAEGRAGYTAYCLSVPGAISQGNEIDDTLDNVTEALTGILEVMNELGDLIPATDIPRELLAA